MISVTCVVWTSNKLQPTTSYTYKQILNVVNVAVLFSKHRVYDSLGVTRVTLFLNRCCIAVTNVSNKISQGIIVKEMQDFYSP